MADSVRDIAGKSWHYYDLWHGVELPAPHSGTIALSMEAAGYGAVLATTNTTADDPVPSPHHIPLPPPLFLYGFCGKTGIHHSFEIIYGLHSRIVGLSRHWRSFSLR